MHKYAFALEMHTFWMPDYKTNFTPIPCLKPPKHIDTCENPAYTSACYCRLYVYFSVACVFILFRNKIYFSKNFLSKASIYILFYGPIDTTQ